MCHTVHIWRLEKWKKNIGSNSTWNIHGLRMHFDKEVDPIVRDFCLDFAKWVRKEFDFPLRVNVYIKKEYRIKAKDGDIVCGTMWRPFNFCSFPYIRLATGDYKEMALKGTEEDAKWEILRCFIHEITHYYQYINSLDLTPIGEERQASRYEDLVLEDYVADQGYF